jgi:hypothetical protein
MTAVIVTVTPAASDAHPKTVNCAAFERDKQITWSHITVTSLEILVPQIEKLQENVQETDVNKTYNRATSRNFTEFMFLKSEQQRNAINDI